MGSEGPCFGDGLIFPFKFPLSTNLKSKILKFSIILNIFLPQFLFPDWRKAWLDLEKKGQK